MALETLTWNLEDNLSKDSEDKARAIVNQIIAAEPTVGIFPEAYKGGDTGLHDNIKEDFDKKDYEAFFVEYDDHDGRQDTHGFLTVVARKAIDSLADDIAQTKHYGGRAVVLHTLHDPDTDTPIEFFGVHLNDRSEAARLQATSELVTDVDPDTRTIVAGDFNSAYARYSGGKKLVAAKAIQPLIYLGLIEPTDPTATENRMTLAQKFAPGRFASQAERGLQMISGKTLGKFEAVGLTDADADHLRTMPAKNPAMQLDHILFSQGLASYNFKRWDHQGLSDHRAIQSTLRVIV